MDLPGPKVRAASFSEHGTDIATGSTLELRVGHDASNESVIEVDYEGLLHDLEVGDQLTIGDGGPVLKITDISSEKLLVTVIHGGQLKGRPGVHLPSQRLRMATPTPSDFVALDAFVELGRRHGGGQFRPLGSRHQTSRDRTPPTGSTGDRQNRDTGRRRQPARDH